MEQRPQAHRRLPSQLAADSVSRTNSYRELVEVDAFRKLKAWNIDVAVEAPAVKEWDCRAESTVAVTRDYLNNIRKAGGSPRFVTMDEPLLSGTSRCGLSLTETAIRTAGYALKLRSDPLPPEIGDIEPYPSVDLAQLKLWIETLGSSGLTLAFFHLDIDLNDVDLNHPMDLVPDLRSLQTFQRQRGIPFGIIFWSGQDPEWSDATYGAQVMDFVRRVHHAIDRPDQAIFQSWVLRASVSCAGRKDCSTSRPNCGPADPPTCGAHSVPLNLPEQADNGFSHTRLLLEALRVLGMP
jgi:hypothetical protein